ncbi:MAG: hypothetical protein RMY36_030290 [Nostoc sp. SerVER01]|nr:hypothetical protein [Nostoc sp. SerVER01]
MVSTLNLSAGDRLQLNYVRILLGIRDWGLGAELIPFFFQAIAFLVGF